MNSSDLAVPKQLVRFTWQHGQLIEELFEVRTYRPTTKVLLFNLGDAPPEGAFNGLKFGRLHQFHLETDYATMIVPRSPTNLFDRQWFLARVNRLVKKGRLNQSPPEPIKSIMVNIPGPGPNEPTDKKVELHVVHTSCKECCFAKYEGKTQVGCSIGRLLKYEAQGTEIVKAEDEEKEFDIINGRQCPAYRDVRSDWAKTVGKKNWRAQVRGELVIRTDIIIPLLDDTSVAGLNKTVESIKGLNLKPLSVIIVNRQDGTKPSEIVAKMNKIGEGLVWYLVDIRIREDDGSKVSLARAMDIGVAKAKAHFYTIVMPGEGLPPTFTGDLDKAISEEMARFVMLLPKPGENDIWSLTGLTVSLPFHNSPMVNGNKPITADAFQEEGDEELKDPVVLDSIVKKAEYLAKLRNAPHLVLLAEEVCKALS